MAHMIEATDTVVTNIGTTRAWHTLDVQRSLNGLSNDEFADQAGLGHRVDLIQLCRADTMNNIEGCYGVFSSLNPEMFRMVGERTAIIQPRNFARFGNTLATNLRSAGVRCDIVSAGTIKGTRLGFISLDLGRKILLPGGDELKQFVTLTISWDGTYRLMAIAMDFRTVCNNTYPSPECADKMSLYEHKGHSQFDPLQAADLVAQRYINAVESERKKGEEVLSNLVSTPFDSVADRQLLRFASVMADGKATIDRIVKLEEDSKHGSFLDKCLTATIDQDAWSKVRTGGMSNTANRIVSETLNGIGSDMDSASGTLWGALNGYTFYADHLSVSDEGKGRKSETPIEDRRLENVLFNRFGVEKQNALLLLSAIAKTH